MGVEPTTLPRSYNALFEGCLYHAIGLRPLRGSRVAPLEGERVSAREQDRNDAVVPGTCRLGSEMLGIGQQAPLDKLGAGAYQRLLQLLIERGELGILRAIFNAAGKVCQRAHS